jgi:hypothetical protein
VPPARTHLHLTTHNVRTPHAQLPHPRFDVAGEAAVSACLTAMLVLLLQAIKPGSKIRKKQLQKYLAQQNAPW